jgi:hypothetical protein
MNAGTLLLVVRDVVNYLESKGLIGQDGSFGVFTPQADAELAVAVEQILKNRGVDVPVKVDKLVAAIPLIVSVLA